MDTLSEIIGQLRIIRQETWKYVYVSATDQEQTKKDYQNVINVSTFGFDVDQLITRLDSLHHAANTNEKMIIGAMISLGFIKLNVMDMAPLEGRFLQLSHFFRLTTPDSDAPIHCAIAKCLMLRNIYMTKALLIHSNEGNALELHMEWFLPSIVCVSPTISSPFCLVQVQSRLRGSSKPYAEGPTGSAIMRNSHIQEDKSR